jgi:hypothetical protein
MVEVYRPFQEALKRIWIRELTPPVPALNVQVLLVPLVVHTGAAFTYSAARSN